MSATRPGWYPDVAPHVESRWREAFVLELRVLGVGGDDVGAALAEVESHVVDSGEAAPEAFGDPVAYARGLGLPVTPAQSGAAAMRATVPAVIQLVGLVLAVSAAGPAASAAPLMIRPGAFALVALGAAVFLAAARWGSTTLAFLAHRRWVALAVVAVVVGAGLAFGLAGQRIVDAVGGDPWQVPSRWALGVGLAAVIGGTAWVWRAGPRTVDLIRGPLDGPPTLPRGVVVMTRVVHGAPLAFTVFLVVVGWAQGRG